ncbi:hypothetical protein BST21_10585 [Mycolicibacterium celeriflavum]|uniref:Uncharacterized protein n=1 Tax=Mycolicibacterium celeriflavum TaxID=1249101 RepID=A0A1X0BVF1_MYCCF|nr:hypothetical protein BST21_10585 [Mycolicibacterium celeriflavum]BBY43423.1 hypothetical protein MCEL_17180 [Mycolicibacterium celeriflavum]
MATISKYQTAAGTTLYRVRYRTPDHRQTDKRGFDVYADLFSDDLESVATALHAARSRESVGKMWARRRQSTGEAGRLEVPVFVFGDDGLADHVARA